MEPDEDALQCLGGAVVAEEAREGVGDGRPGGGPLVGAERDLRRVPEEQRRHDQRDQTENQVGLAQVAPLKPGGALHLADAERGHHADEHEHAEDVDEEEVPPLVSEPGQRPVRVDGSEERHRDRREEDDEAPEDERVDKARDEPLEELPLAEHHGRLGARTAADLAGALRRLAKRDDPVEEMRPPREQAPGHRERGEQSKSGGDRAHPDREARIAAEIAGTTSCRSPITA